MLENLDPRETLRGLARARARDYNTRTVNTALLDEALSSDWSIEKRNRKSVRLRQPKAPLKLLEDRIWTLLYKTGFSFLSGLGVTRLLNQKDSEHPCTEISVVGIDAELALAISCVARDHSGKEPRFREIIQRHASLRQAFSTAVRKQYQSEESPKLQVVLALFCANIDVSNADRREPRNNRYCSLMTMTCGITRPS